MMLSKYVMPGNKLDIQTTGRVQNADETEHYKVYQSQVYDVLSDDRLEIYMPMEKTKLVLLPVDVEYVLHFYTTFGLYRCFARVIDRYKADEKFILLLELTGNLQKYQRREFYRLSCVLDMESRLLEKEEIKALENNDLSFEEGLPLKKSIIVDISGGGLRFVADFAYEADSMIFCKYYLKVEGKDKEYVLAARVLSVYKVEGKTGLYEHRVQYVKIDNWKREQIIRYIFEEERKSRKREIGE